MAETLYMETTKISVLRTCSEIEECLAKFGIKHFQKTFEKDGEVKGIAFTIEIAGSDLTYKLPFRWEEIQKLAQARKTGRPVQTSKADQARRVAARNVLRWVQSQVAMLKINMADLAEVFLPYQVVDHEEHTFYEVLADGGRNRIPELAHKLLT